MDGQPRSKFTYRQLRAAIEQLDEVELDYEVQISVITDERNDGDTITSVPITAHLDSDTRLPMIYGIDDDCYNLGSIVFDELIDTINED